MKTKLFRKLMNIKLHTPKSLSTGSGMSSMRQFMLSLLATTVSIVLTFGTAAVVDNQKKQREKRKIVMMVMYDMYNTLQIVEKNDSSIRAMMDIQCQIAEDTALFNTMKFQLAYLLPKSEFTETTEHIFSSSIESINTVGNVLFNENVAQFYLYRKNYKTAICDSITHSVVNDMIFTSLNSVLDYDFFIYAAMSNEFRACMQELFIQCKQMMGISDKEIEAYKNERDRMEEGFDDIMATKDSIEQEIVQLARRLRDATKEIDTQTP